ncbi:MAG: XrtA/PEP-CTERM system histidine kinase PrsK [Pseudomonadota bacterium]
MGVAAHGAAAVAFLIVTGLLMRSWGESRAASCLVVASAMTAIWALAAVASVHIDPLLSLPYFLYAVSPLETLRTAAWLVFLIVVLMPYWRIDEKLSFSFILSVLISFLFTALLVVDIGVVTGAIVRDGASAQWLTPFFVIGRLSFAVGALALVENLYRSTAQDDRWGIRLFAIGLAAFFIYDIYLYSDALLFRRLDADIFNNRGAVNAMVAPLIAISAARNPGWRVNVSLSRRLVFHTVSLMGTGIYLIFMSAAGYYLREYGGEWGDLLQVSLFAAMLLLLILVLASGQFRGRARVFVNKHFFNYKYDYREEWLRFIRTVSQDTRGEPLNRRIIRAVCDIVDSPGGLLWLPEAGNETASVMLPAERWNFGSASDIVELDVSALRKFLTEKSWVIDLDQMRDDENAYEGIRLPDAMLANEQCWLLLPLIHKDQLIACLLVERARAERSLNFEDFDLMRTVGTQGASYLAESRLVGALAEAQEFEAFNRRFAFIMHDLKNLVSQLSLIARNAERHADKPEFRKDMVLTLQDSVGKMNDMLARLHNQSDAPMATNVVEIKSLVQAIVEKSQLSYPSLTMVSDDAEKWAEAQPEKLQQVLSHLIQNAYDASEPGSPVIVRVLEDKTAGLVSIEVEDKGCGMSEAFVQTKLFQPFRSTKEAGFGIGAYESRSMVRSFGGHLKVVSREGEGTTMIIKLKHSDRASEVALEDTGVPGDPLAADLPADKGMALPLNRNQDDGLRPATE